MAVVTKCKVTTDHQEIRRWAIARDGKPAATIVSESHGEKSRICICFVSYGKDRLVQEISWDNWFKKFDKGRLAFLYQEQTANGEKSTFNKLVTRESVDEVESAVGGKGRSASRRRSRRDRDARTIGASLTAKPAKQNARSAGPSKGGEKPKQGGKT
jgi:hypothetical protein